MGFDLAMHILGRGLHTMSLCTLWHAGPRYKYFISYSLHINLETQKTGPMTLLTVLGKHDVLNDVIDFEDHLSEFVGITVHKTGDAR